MRKFRSKFGVTFPDSPQSLARVIHSPLKRGKLGDMTTGRKALSAKRSKPRLLLGVFLAAILSIAPLVAGTPPSLAAGAACPATSYLPNTSSYPSNDPGTLVNDKYILSGNIYYKLNRTTAEAVAVGYVRSYTGALTVPEDLVITASEIQAAGFDSVSANCSAFAMSYKVRYVGPAAFIAGYNQTAPVLSAINIEANLKVIGREAFVAQCRIETLVIPDSVTDIGKTAFGGMNSTTGPFSNGNCDYAANEGLKSVVLGVNLKRFYDTAFNQNQRINSVTFRGEPLSPSPGDFPAEYDLWNTGSRNFLVGGAINNTCTINFTYVFNLSVRILAGSRASWTPWALANNCFTQTQIDAFAADVTTPPSQAVAPIASNPTQTTADVSFTAPGSDGGSPITSYVITSFPDAVTSTSAGPNGGTITVTGLNPGTTYSFRVQAINANGSSSPSALSNQIATSALTAPNISLSIATETTAAGTSMSGYTITNTGGPVASYSISPTVSNGLSFNTTTGLLSGSPTAEAVTVVYTIQATNAAGSDTATFSITVVAPTVVTPISPPQYEGPMVTSPRQIVFAGDLVVLRGTRLDLLRDLLVGTLKAEIISSTETTLQFRMPSSIPVGIYDLKFESSYGHLTVIQGIEVVLRPETVNTENLEPLTVINSSIFFRGDSSSLTRQAKYQLDQLVKKLRGKTVKKIVVLGYVMRTASQAYDAPLSLNRARAVANYLRSKGIKASYSSLGVGIDLNGTPKARRADLAITLN